MSSIALVLLLLVVGLAGALLSPTLYAKALREMFRSTPEAREAFVGSGSWIGFSRRFGLPYAIGALALAVAWIVVGSSTVPDTELGAWLLFGPTMLLGTVGICLGALVVCRRMVER
jgi:hypothetical protein